MIFESNRHASGTIPSKKQHRIKNEMLRMISNLIEQYDCFNRDLKSIQQKIKSGYYNGNWLSFVLDIKQMKINNEKNNNCLRKKAKEFWKKFEEENEISVSKIVDYYLTDCARCTGC